MDSVYNLKEALLNLQTVRDEIFKNNIKRNSSSVFLMQRIIFNLDGFESQRLYIKHYNRYMRLFDILFGKNPPRDNTIWICNELLLKHKGIKYHEGLLSIYCKVFLDNGIDGGSPTYVDTRMLFHDINDFYERFGTLEPLADCACLFKSFIQDGEAVNVYDVLINSLYYLNTVLEKSDKDDEPNIFSSI
jgi:hypothetical protein